MAVYKRTYHGYDGPLTDSVWRFLVLPRYSFEEMRKNKRLANFFMFSFAWPLVATFLIYLNHNLSLIRLLKLNSATILKIDTNFFLLFLGIQCMLSFFVAAFGGPGLIAPDLANNAVPLYLARPFSRAEYVLGKASVLIILLSAMTWVPGTILFMLESNLSGPKWMWENIRIPFALFLGAWTWILVVTSLALAFSAWVRMKHLSSAVLFVFFFGSTAFAFVTNGALNTKWGSLLDIRHSIGTVWLWLFDRTPIDSNAVFFSVNRDWETPAWASVVILTLLCAFCLRMLLKKIRGTEVVR